MRQRTVFLVGQEALTLGVPENLLGCPFVVGTDHGVRQINRYLQDRYLGRWQPRMSTRRRRFRPSPGTVKQSASRLNNFLNWLSTKDLFWEEITELHLDEYARDMESGDWTSDEKSEPLAASTIASRQSEVLQVMLWEKTNGERSFEPMVSHAKFVESDLGGGTQVRTRRVYDVVRRPNPADILFPTVAQVKAHVQSIQDPALQLGVRLIYECGLRASEPGGLKVSYLPGHRRAGGFGSLQVLGKGNKIRRTEISADLEAELVHFKDFDWPLRRGRRPEECDPLLINTKGGPLSYRAIWKQFSACDWSPHMGRHYYAIQYLLQEWEARKLLAKRENYHLSIDHMPHILSQSLLLLMKNLGHADLKTTQRYLVALSQYTRNCDIALAFQGELDD